VVVRARDNDDAEYRRRAERAGRDASAWWTLAQWAQAHGLPGSAGDAARRVVELSPDHAGARALLGEEKVGAVWLDKDAAMRAKGYVEYRGEWLKKDEAAALEQARRDERREERLDEYLALERARAPAPGYGAPAYYPAVPDAWWLRVASPEADQRRQGPYTVPWRPQEPFAPSFHEGYFRRAGF
jgi:hypothetical protein